jgi:hypothetical protein
MYGGKEKEVDIEDCIGYNVFLEVSSEERKMNIRKRLKRRMMKKDIYRFANFFVQTAKYYNKIIVMGGDRMQ